MKFSYDEIDIRKNNIEKLEKSVEEAIQSLDDLLLTEKREKENFNDLIFANILKFIHDFSEECHLSYNSETRLCINFYKIRRKYRQLISLALDENGDYHSKDLKLFFRFDKESGGAKVFTVSGFDNKDAMREFIALFVPNLGFIDKIKMGVVESQYK